MHPLTRLGLGLVGLILILGGVAFALPNHVSVVRSVVINAPESDIFPYINDLHRFPQWAPWPQRDPQLKITYEGPQEGKGATLHWTSDRRSVGTATISIVNSDPNRRVDAAVNYNGLSGTSSYELTPEGAGSKLTWGFGSDTGSNPFSRWRGLMLDRFVGADYREGLAKLKEQVEAERQPTAQAPAGAGSDGTSPAVTPEASPAQTPADAGGQSSTQAETPPQAQPVTPAQPAKKPQPSARPKKH